MLDFIKQVTILFYKLRPKAFGIGYNQFKIKLIKKLINEENIVLKNYMDERIVEIPWIMKNLANIENYNIMDGGCTLNFNYLIKKIIQKNNNLTFINIHPERNFFRSKLVKYRKQDITKINFKQNTFDAVTCLSVIEHVGFDNSMYDYTNGVKKKQLNQNLYKKGILELKRVLKPGRWLYLTFPFGKKMIFKNYQQFNYSDLQSMIKIFSPKKYWFEFYKFDDLKWNKVDAQSCKFSKAVYKNDIGISSTSVALLKMKK